MYSISRSHLPPRRRRFRVDKVRLAAAWPVAMLVFLVHDHDKLPPTAMLGQVRSALRATTPSMVRYKPLSIIVAIKLASSLNHCGAFASAKDCDGDLEPELAASTQRAVKTDAAIVLLNKRAANGQSQPCTLALLLNAGIDLLKRSKDPGEVVLPDANPMISNSKSQCHDGRAFLLPP